MGSRFLPLSRITSKLSSHDDFEVWLWRWLWSSVPIGYTEFQDDRLFNLEYVSFVFFSKLSAGCGFNWREVNWNCATKYDEFIGAKFSPVHDSC